MGYRNVSIKESDFKRVIQMLEDERVDFLTDVYIKKKHVKTNESKELYEFLRSKGIKNVVEGVIYYGNHRNLRKAFEKHKESLVIKGVETIK